MTGVAIRVIAIAAEHEQEMLACETTPVLVSGRPCWTRTSDQRIMRATSAFAARFRFVVWTLSCLSAFPSSLYTFSSWRSFARRWHGALASTTAFTEFEKFYLKAE